MYKIESGIPIPKPKGGDGTRSPERDAIESLRPGESFLMAPGEASFRKARNLGYYVAQAEPKATRRRFAVRVVDDGVRVWRIS